MARFIAAGGYAIVYLARDLAEPNAEADPQVALKVLRHEWCGDRVIVERFLQEGKFLSRISNARVVHCFAVGAIPKPWMALEYVAGPTLETVLSKRKRLSPTSAMTVTAATLEALSAAHEVGIAHRDIKPSNIAFVHNDPNADSTVKLLDFGLAREWSLSEESTRLTGTNEIVGTALYMAPERITQRDVEPCADVCRSYAVDINA